MRLTDEQESALQALAFLEELQFKNCSDQEDLPMGLHSLSSLKRLEIIHCWNITRLLEKASHLRWKNWRPASVAARS